MSDSCIVVKDLWYRYTDEIIALKGIDLEIPRGAFVAVLGQNGSGKTTLVKHLNGLLKPTKGCVLINGQDTTKYSVGHLARTTGYVFQNPDHQIFCSTTREEIEFGPRNLDLSPEKVAQRADQTMEYFGLTAHADDPPALLGFGLRRKISIAAVYAMRPDIFILDEPTTGLDWKSTMDMIRLIQALHRDGHTILLVTHDMKIAAAFTDLSLVLRDGQVLLYGDTRSVFCQTAVLRETQIEPPQITELADRLRPFGMPEGILTVEECFNAYCKLKNGKGATLL
ncbi:MAG: ABC transporter ATP-binding protein [Anaerolineales bacterium]|nr:ABC transporter ATP-binding protein [Anaerolineales bacterium]